MIITTQNRISPAEAPQAQLLEASREIATNGAAG